jgi:GNAT superfamily N-acetyltransferase
VNAPALDVRPARADDEAIGAYLELFRTCFPAAAHYTRDYLAWLYRDNPAGPVVGFDAWDGDVLAAHYACVPAHLRVGGAACRGLLSLNTATRPSHQGQGLFTRLAELAYGRGAREGFACVYGVANANSTPGFTRKLGFQLVRPLDALVGWGGSGGADLAEAWRSADFARPWDARDFAWRAANPANPLRAFRCGEGTCALGRTGRFGILASAQLPQPLPVGARAGTAWRLRPRLSLGLLPAGCGRSALYRAIPQRLRPSPLNLIYRDLSGADRRIDPRSVYFTFLDFDAY